MREADEGSREENALILPGEIRGKKAVWKYRSNMVLPVIAGAFAAAAVFLLRQQEDALQKEIRRRKKMLSSKVLSEIDRTLPEFIAAIDDPELRSNKVI